MIKDACGSQKAKLCLTCMYLSSPEGIDNYNVYTKAGRMNLIHNL